MEEQGANRAREVINRSIELSNSGEVGKALDLLDDFLSEAARKNRGDWIRPDGGLPLFWLRRWVTLGGSGNTPSYVSRTFLVMLLRCITSHGPQCITSLVFGIGEWWKASPCSRHDQLVIKDPVLIHSKDTMPDLTVLQEQPPYELAESLLESALANQSGMKADGIEATNIQQ